MPTLVLRKKTWLSLDLVHLVFESDLFLVYSPGQYLDLVVPNLGTHSYSIANSFGTNTIEFCIRVRSEGKVSPFFGRMEVGDTIQSSKPKGTFTRDYTKESVLICTGSGIAPFRAMIQEACECGLSESIFLLQGGRYSVPYYSEFSTLCYSHPPIWYHSILSKAGEVKGHVGDLLTTIPVSFIGNYYLCGNENMITEVKDKLAAGGVAPERIITEAF